MAEKEPSALEEMLDWRKYISEALTHDQRLERLNQLKYAAMGVEVPQQFPGFEQNDPSK